MTRPSADRLATPSDILGRISNPIGFAEATIPEFDPELAERVAKRFRHPGAEEQVRADIYAGAKAERMFREIVDAVVPAERRDVKEELLDPDFLRVTAAPLIHINAQAVVAPNGGTLIVLNFGLIVFLYKFARALATRVGFRDEPVSGSADQAITIIVQLLDWALSPAAMPRSSDFDARDSQIGLASALTTAAERFVLCHELAHVVLGHHAAATRSEDTIQDVALTSLRPEWQHELAADAAGLRLMLDVVKARRLDPSVEYAGVELFFHALRLVDDHGDLPDAKSHPPPAQRLEHLRGQLASGASRETQEVLTRLSSPLSDLVDDLRPRILEVALERKTSSTLELRTLLDECAAGDRPDHRRFQERVWTMLGETPAVVLSSLRAELMTLTSARRDEVAPSSLNRWKLAFVFAMNLPPALQRAIGLKDFMWSFRRLMDEKTDDAAWGAQSSD